MSELDVIRFGLSLTRARAPWSRWAPRPEHLDRMREDLEAAAYVLCLRLTRTEPRDPVTALRKAIAGASHRRNRGVRTHFAKAREVLSLHDAVERRIVLPGY